MGVSKVALGKALDGFPGGFWRPCPISLERTPMPSVSNWPSRKKKKNPPAWEARRPALGLISLSADREAAIAAGGVAWDPVSNLGDGLP